MCASIVLSLSIPSQVRKQDQFYPYHNCNNSNHRHYHHHHQHHHYHYHHYHHAVYDAAQAAGDAERFNKPWFGSSLFTSAVCAAYHVFCQRISDRSSTAIRGEMDSSFLGSSTIGCQRRQLLRFLLFLLLLLLTSVQKGTASELSDDKSKTTAFKGPEFVVEPPSQVDFSNSTGSRIECSASGLPPPQVTWLRADGTAVVDVPSLRQVTADHTLVFFPFRAEEYRQDIHAVVYKCVVTNDVGTVVSRDVKVRGVVKQYYEVQVYDEYVIRGNTAVLKCQVPSFVRDYVRVTSWVVDETHLTSSNANPGNRYMVALTGELYIHQVERNDSYKPYRCRTIHQLTNETQASAPARVIVTDPQSSVPPRVTHSMAFVMAKQKNTLQLPCVAQGYPVPNYRWFKTVNKQLEPINFRDGRFHRHGGILTIERVIISDTGTYVCVVNNSVGEERVEITLAVTSSLSVSIQPQKQMVDAGKPAAFRCSVSGHPIGAISWSKDGRPLEPSENVHLTARDEVRIRQVQRQDIGMYQCFVENDDESVQGTAEIMLGDAAPVFVHTFSSETHQPGTTVSLRCVASGNPPPKVSWMIDGGPLAENRRLSLGNSTRGRGEVTSYVNISKTRVEDGGEYSCIGINSIGRSEHTARLSVYGLPYIRPLSNQTVVAGQTMQLTCRAAGYPIQSISWERDGVPLPANLRQKTFANGTLIIQEVERLTDEGVYTCIARNSQGQSARRSVWIVVMAPPKIDRFNFPPDLREGMRTRISCIVSDGDLPISITWLKDGEPIPKTLGVQILNNDEFSSSITFRSVSALHNGNYTCVASNAAATVRHTAELLAHVLPRWSVEPKDLEILSGRQAVLNCQAEGFPRPIITWLRSEGGATGDFKPVMDSGNWYRLLDNGSLVIMHVSKDSEGHFLCQATNGIGSGLSKVISIRVNVPAYFDSKSSNQTVRKGDDAILRCEANGDTPIKIMWTRNRERINMELEPTLSLKEHSTPRGLASQLMVRKTERKDASTFSCVATNAYGHDETVIELTVQEPPSASTGLKVVEVTSRSVQLTWGTTDSGNSPIQRYVIHFRNMTDGWNSPIKNISSPGPETAYNVEGLLPGNTYQMWVVAENALGRSGNSEVIEVTCSQEVPGGPPVGVEAKAVGSSTIKITWKPPKKELWNGDILGYYVGYKIYDSTENYVYKTVKVTTDFKEEILLGNLQKFTKYSVVVQAFNRVGSGPDSDEVIAYTLEDVPSEAPQSVQCVTSTSQSIHVTWLPPPPQSQNGVVRGYKVVYSVTDDNIMRDYNIQETAVVQPAATKTNIHNLEKYTNYSIQVLAFTRMGDGTLSTPVYCRTNEDVPGPPADVKALVMSSDAILVAWRPPARQNGIILKYTLYMRQADKGGGSNQHPTKHILSSIPNLSYEVRSLKESLRYEFWVTASTVIGEGESTRVIGESPKSRVPARIASFPETIASPYKVEVKLPCRAVGNPTPTREWKLMDKKMKEGDRFSVATDGSLIISNVHYTDSGNYSCSVVNAYGSDDVQHILVVRAPPISPVLTIVQTTKSSITLSWKQGDDGGSRIQGYSLSYKREFGEWEEIEVEPSEDGVTLNNLSCGSRYQAYLTAYNRMGTGQPTNILQVLTDGSAPNVPARDDVLEPNVTSVLLRLDKWPDGGCRVLYFVVHYKPKTGRTWLLVSNNIQPEVHREFFISDLLPGTWYSVQITVHNDAGSTTAEYDFITLSRFGESLPSDMADEPREESLPFYSDLNLVLPLAASLACLTVAGVGVCLFNRRRKYRGYRHSQNNINLDTANDVKNKMNEIRNNANETENHLELTYSPTSGKKLEGQGFPDDVAPYATFNLPGCRADHELQAMQLQTFSEKNSNPPPNAANVGNVTNPTYPAQRTDDLYSKVKKRQYAAPKLLTQTTQQNDDGVVEVSPDNYAKSEDSYSAQSQYGWNKRNYGSVPSYRRPSVASDYDPSSIESPETREKVYDYYNHPTLLIQERHQVPDLIYHTTDSSTSNESSPDEQRRPRRMNRTGRYSSPRWSYVNNDRINRWVPEMEIPVTDTALNYPQTGKYVNGPNPKSPERERGTTTFRNDSKVSNAKYRNYGKAPLEDLEQMAQVPCYHTKNRPQCLDENCPEDTTIRV